MDLVTVAAYDDTADARAELYGTDLSSGARLVLRYLDPGERVLDIGSGSGRDVKALIDHGYQAFGIEPSAGMRQAAAERFGLGPDRIAEGSLPDIGDSARSLGGSFDAILLSAVLQHVGDRELFDSLFSVHELLVAGGYLILTHPVDYPGIAGEPPRDTLGRLFVLRPGAQYDFLLARMGYRIICRSSRDDGLGRSGVRWEEIAFRKESETGKLRPLEAIDSVIREDKKSRSYKFALIRALAELAGGAGGAPRWTDDGKAAIPVETVVDKWVEYYWPIVESEIIILQGPDSARAVDMKFRPGLAALVASWRGRGGCAAFMADLSAGRLSAEDEAAAKMVRAHIGSAIMNGPVIHAALANNRLEGPLFTSMRNEILVPEEIWTELCLLSPWIRASAILDWASFSADLKGQDPRVTRGMVLDLLDSPLRPERDVFVASRIYEPRLDDGLRCVWSGSSIRRLAIDHALPYSLWWNNDLWNLLPTEASVNLNKKARLPSRACLLGSKERILESWSMAFESEPALFLKGAERFGGLDIHEFGRSERDDLFRAFAQAFEVTAMTRGVERWEP